jgi:hypothetical protein
MNVDGDAIPATLLVNIYVYANAWAALFHYNRWTVFFHYHLGWRCRCRRGRYFTGSRSHGRWLASRESHGNACESEPGKERQRVFFHLVDSFWYRAAGLRPFVDFISNPRMTKVMGLGVRLDYTRSSNHGRQH